MPCWPLLLPPPAVSISTSPSRLRGSSSSIVIEVESPSCRPSPSSCRRGRTIPCRRAVPSITLYSPSRRSSPPIAVVLSVHRRRARAVPRRRGAIAPSLAVKEPLCRPLPYHAPPWPLIWMVVALPLLTPPPSICRCLSLWHRLLSLSSIWLVVTSRHFSRRHLPSAGASASHRAIASCHGIIKEEGVGASGDDDERPIGRPEESADC